MVDLHVHSTRSDGTYTPEELVDYAIEKGLTAFALTDHDTVDGLDDAYKYAATLKDSRSYVPDIIPGIELSTEYEGRDIHIVGLNIDYKNEDFTAYLNNFIESRERRNRKMCALLSEYGVNIDYDNLAAEFPGSVITRAHFAKYMLNHGHIKSISEAFDRYIGDYAPCFIPREKVTPAQAVRLILSAHGIPVLAHPILYHMSDARLDRLVCELKADGLIGIEAIYSTYNAGEEHQIRNLAKKYDLCISGGSDFHGANKPGLDLAVGYGNLCVPDSVWDKLKTINP
jgi:predicted metal-dependent phosphoesterase TrpH